MTIQFSKYQGAGNDFIIIDCRKNKHELTEKYIQFLCNRRFGIGADGLMTIHNSTDTDFAMKYYNSDGKEASMCGNGGRCIARYAFNNNIAKDNMVFSAIDGTHSAYVKNNYIELSMADVEDVKQLKDGFFLNTGSPHFIKIVNDISQIDVRAEGLKLANDKRFAPDRTNVDFIDIKDDKIRIATYERGVENETLACGTGAVAAAIVLFKYNFIKKTSVSINAKGGVLIVSFKKSTKKFANIILSGPAEKVFNGTIEVVPIVNM
ncbi:MAG TPA: diaminopimelate epimerase [Bacteroidales bacterium]|nr:diaminopimelate epimerase [Bacteroidales bacterium]